MKTKVKRLSKRSLSMFLAVLMMVSVLGIGTLITANAADPTGFTSGTYVYLVPGTNWYNNSKKAAAYFYNSDSDNAWSSVITLSTSASTKNRITVPGSNKTWAHVIFVSLNRSATAANWNNKWNQTGNLNYDSGKNCFTNANDSWDGATTTWSKYVPTSSATLSASPSSITTSQTSTLSPGISGNTTYNEYKSVSYSILPNSGASISGNTFTPTAAGTYTVTATVTYNAKGFPGATATAENTADITVTVPTTPNIDTFTIDGATSKTLNIGETATLASTTSNTSNSVTYSTTSDAISITGTTVKALKPVTSATITATLVDGSTYTKTVTVKVNTPSFTLSYSPSTIPATGSTTATPTVAISNANASSTKSSLSYSITSGGSYASINSSTGVVTSKSSAGSVTAKVTGTISYNGVSYTTAEGTATITVQVLPTVYFDVIYNKSSGWSDSDNKGGSMTYDADATAAAGGGMIFKLTTATNLVANGSYYLRIWDGSNNYRPSSEISSQQLLSGSGVSCDKVNETKKMTAGAAGKYNFYYDVTNHKVYVEYPHTVTFNSKGGTAVSSQVVNYGGKATAPSSNPTKTGYTFDKWVTTDGGSTAFNFSTTSITADTTVYAKWTAKTSALTFNLNGGSGTAQTGLTATYGSAMPSYTNAKPTKTGYTFAGFYDAQSGGTQYYTSALASAKNWDKNTTDGTPLYAHWTEVKAGATVKAYTDGSASGTGGTVKVGTTGTPGATATINNSSFGIDTNVSVLVASTTSGYTFEGWETGGTYGSHVKLYTDPACVTPYDKSTNGGDYTTIYVKTDGTSGMTTSNTEIHAMFESAKYTITNNGAYHKTGAAAYTSGTTGGTFTVSSTGELSYNTNITLTATAASGYAVEGIYWSTDGTTWTKVETSDTKSGGYITASTNNTFKVTDNFRLKAQFVQVLKLSAFDSYEMKNNQVLFVTSPPKQIVIKHTDAHGTVTSYTYAYDATKAKGNPNTPGAANASGTLSIASGSYGQGNYIQYYAGDEITLTYSAMATSEILKGVFYNNSAEFYVTKPDSSQFVEHSHPSTSAIYMNSAYYTSTQLGGRSFTGVTSDNDAHSVKFTGTQDYKNIDVEIGTKRKVYFSDYKNTVISSKNMDDYYYDGEALSETGDQLTVKAKQSATQTNSITATNVRYYKANADGSKGTELTTEEKSALGLSITGSTSTSSSSADGAALVFNGNMPAYDLYIDLNMANSYTLKLGTKIVSDLGGSNTRLKEAATTISIAGSTTLNANTSGYVTSGSTSVSVGSAATLTVSGLSSGYMFVGWYWGDDTAPDYEKGFISDKLALSYAPRKGGTIWAVGTKDLFINGSKYITGKASNWYAENSTQKNLEMSFDAETGRYYWEITDTMFAAAGNEYKTWEENNNNTTYGTYQKGGDNYYYWYDNDDKYHGKSFFQFFDTESGNNNKSIWNQLTSFKVDTPANGPTYGKIYPSADDYGTKTWNGQGFINFYESSYPGYSSPLRIYYDPNATDNAKLTVEATPIYSDLYVSNGYDVGSTVKSDAVTVEPVVDGVVKTSGQTGYFSVGAGTTYSPDHEGTVTKYTPAKKGATVRITKKAGGSDKIAAFLIYDTENRTVRAEKNITKGTTSNSKTPYYIDLTLENVKQSLYIVPIVEEAVPNGAKQVTITFDATQLNRKQWGDIVTAYAWYKTSNAPGLGAYPGQPMIPSDDMSTWTTSFVSIKSGNELAGITFSNYVDGTHSWLGCTGVMGTVSDAQQKSGEATGGIINVYNHVSSGDNGEYSRTNYKAQTYDYHEPIALYDRYKNEDSVNITFQMKDGNSSLISWRHHEFDDNNILNLPSGWGKLNWEYLTNAKGDQYVDMNGSPLGANNKPTATFYVAAKGQVVYNNSTMNYVFHGGHDYEMKGYIGTYSDPTGGADRGSYAKTALASGQWDDNITYGGTNSLDMKYGVQWYVYDAQGNYITTVLSAGIADLSSNNVDTYIAKELEDKGYAVDGKSVAICYDKPRYMYGDWNNVTNSANNINCGPNFDAYRFEGQWIAAAQSDTVKVNVEVAMMTDSGEVLANSNTAGYGNATAGLKSGVTFGKPAYATSSSDGSWAQTAATDAKLNGIVLNASSQNFIGWYYYDANTNEFTKANYTGNEDFRPNYTNKDVTYYAVYRASAVYKYNYVGREGNRTYSAAGNDLTESELSNNSVINPASHEADIKLKVPVGIGIFKENIDFTATNYDSWTKTPDNNGYVLDITGFTTSTPTYTLTAHYKLANGNDATITKTAAYNGAAVNLTDLNGGAPVTSYYGKKFLGWYAYDNGTQGELISTQTNYGLRLTREQAVIAVYDENGSTTVPEDGWHVSIDENEVNKELTTSETGVYYNDTIVRVRNGSDVRATLPSGAKIGVLVVCDNKTNETINGYDSTQLTTLANAVTSGSTRKTAKGISITNMQATSQTTFNRTDIAVRRDYKTTLGAKYCVYAYIKDGSTYTFSRVSAVKTYE